MQRKKEVILSREQYAEILAAFRKSNVKCFTNRWFMSELATIIQGGKLYTEECDGTLWFLSDEEKYYNAQVFVAADRPVHMCHQNKDIVVELTGKGNHYDLVAEQKLLAAGFEKYHKYLEMECHLDASIDKIREWLELMRCMWGKEGFKCRKAIKDDYPELRRLWSATIGRGKDRYTVPSLTRAQLEEMERCGRCSVICDAQGRILAARNYWKRDKAFYGHIVASYQLGLGGWAMLENLLSEYEEGAARDVGWVAEDNDRSLGLSKNLRKPTGKYFWQFIYRSKKL